MKWEKIMTLRQSQAVKIITQCETIEYLFLISREQLKIRNFGNVIIFALPRNVFDRAKWSIFSANVQFFFQRVRRDIQHISRVYDIQCYISLERWRLNLSISKVFFKKNLERYFVWPRVVNCRIWVFQPIHFQPLRFSCGSSERIFKKYS